MPRGRSARERLEARRVDRVGGDVGDRRQLVGAGGEIARIGEQQRAEEEAGNGAADAGEALRQIVTNAAPNDTGSPSAASTRAAPNVASAGTISRKSPTHER